ncbi:MAG: hypothetical protein GXP16_17665 [Gammaproteobacteria bacterium]|nr:hypothetical protein [Gammaproteobacteria bacterium]
MNKVLHIEASPRGSDSGSSQLACWFLSAYSQANPQDAIVKLNVFETELPPFDADAAHTKFAPIFREDVSESQAAMWQAVREMINSFDANDKIVVSCPMWNYSIPYRLKHYFDIIVQPILTFGYDHEQKMNVGLLRNRPVQLLLTRSSTPPGDYADFQLPYLRYVLGSIGIRDVRVVTAWQTAQPTAKARFDYLESFRNECNKLGAAF